MLNFFKNFFRHEDKNVFQDMPVPSAAAPAAHKTPGTSFRPRTPQAPMQVAPRPVTPIAADGDCVQVSLASVFSTLPVELKSRVLQPNVGTATMSISVERVLPQLASGSVKLPFGEIRMAAPQLFSPAADADHVPVALPLSDILRQVNPSLLVRRQQQKSVDVPEEIHSPFGEEGAPLAFTVSPKADTTHAARAVSPAPAAPVKPAMAARPISPSTPIPTPTFVPRTAPVSPAAKTPTASHTPKPAPTPAAVPFQQFHPKPSSTTSITRKPVQPVQPQIPTPFASIQQHQPLPMLNVTPAAPLPPEPVAMPEEPAQPIPMSSALRGLTASLGAPMPTNTPTAKATVPTPAPAPAAAVAEGPTLSVPLAAVSEGWTEALRQEILQLGLTDAIIALPVNPVQEAMKRGKVVFSWKALRSWIRPAPAPTVSMHDSALVELPLKELTPLFIAYLKGPKAQHKVAIDENIPNLFFGFPQSEPAPEVVPAASAVAPAPVAAFATSTPGTSFQPAARQAETNYYVWGDTSDSARVDETEFKRAPSVETNFLSRYATPNEVVSRASALPGVVGALVALPDGLMVASKLPSDVNGDTLAGFLPQIFGKVAACTRELRMGELNNLNFTVGNIPWKIFRVNAIFFAAFGRAGQGLPTADLATLAAQLDRKKPQ
jgi:predicted regulator of Ras-like GTPase activity (Roadblock/LC7/MglB family)